MTTLRTPPDGLPELQRAIGEALRSYQEMSAQFTRAIEQLDFKPYSNALMEIANLSESVVKYAPFIASYHERLEKILKKSQLLDDSGWLPHPTLPMTLFDLCDNDNDKLSRLIEEYYRSNWEKVRSELVARVSRFDVDDEAKQTFLEALDAYDHQMYRSVCRLLMPEIERVTRIKLNDGSLGDFIGKDAKITKPHKLLQEFACSLTLDDVEPRNYLAMTLFVCLTEHLYAQIKTDDDLKKFETDPIPNRHATVHGLVSYRTAQNALNTIFMTDFIFQVVTAIRSLPEVHA